MYRFSPLQVMKAINLAYEEAVKSIDAKADLDEAFRKVIDNIVNFEGIDNVNSVFVADLCRECA